MRWIWRAKTQYSEEVRSWVGDPQMAAQSQLQWFSPKECGVWVPHQAPYPRGAILRRQIPRISGCEGQ